MFTGIVEEIGAVKESSSQRLVIEAKKVLEGTKVGDSIAVNGVCLTITFIAKNDFSADIMPATLRHTNLGKLRYGDLVNLERALVFGSRVGGHIVQGHVDAVGKVVSMLHEGEAVIMEISIPRGGLLPYVVIKGFIAVDGVSLTVINCNNSSFSVSLVGYTRQNTILGSKKPGNLVNLEVDVIAKYVERLKHQNRRGLTLDFLIEHGFSKVG